jgi:hypothetical protein
LCNAAVYLQNHLALKGCRSILFCEHRRLFSGGHASFRDRLAESARLLFAAIAAFLQSLLQTRGSFTAKEPSVPFKDL